MISLQWYSGCHQTGRCNGDIKTAQSLLTKRGIEAARLLKESGADHVLYGCKVYSKGTLAAVQFFMEPMSEERFYKATSKVNQAIIYAVHRH